MLDGDPRRMKATCLPATTRANFSWPAATRMSPRQAKPPRPGGGSNRAMRC